MIWQNPWAWLGLAAIAIPVLIHLLGRDKAPRHSFPSLRFIEIAELPPTRRTRLHDLLLLATRAAIFAFAAAALAQPLLLSANRRASIDSRLARAIIVDTSASMLRTTASGVRALDSARRAASRLAGDARTSIVVEASSPSSAIRGAVGWLESQSSRREVVVVSDFQMGAVDSAAIATVPLSIGVRPVPIGTTSNASLKQLRLVRDLSVVANVEVANDPTVVSWTLGGLRDSVGRAEPKIAIESSDRASADALTSAAKTVSVAAPVDTAIAVAIVFPGAPNRDALMKRAMRVSSPPLVGFVARLLADSLLASTQGYASGIPTASAPGNGAAHLGPVVQNISGVATAIAAEDTAGGLRRLLVFSYDSATSVNSATLVGAVRRSLSAAPSISELDPSTIAASLIASWRRAPSAIPTRETVDSANGPSDGRWLWLIVLALLAVEAWLRRERVATAVRIQERAHDRAA